jgi:hypothetical protein
MTTLDALFTWSLQFDIPIWFILLLALGLGLSIAYELHARRRARGRHQDIAANRRRYVATNFLSSLR